jgi:hypothetical protein
MLGYGYGIPVIMREFPGFQESADIFRYIKLIRIVPGVANWQSLLEPWQSLHEPAVST